MGSKYQPYEVSEYQRRMNEFRYLTLEEELELVRRYRNGDSEAGRMLVEANLRNVVKVSRNYFYQGYDPLEIIQEGNLGLMRALPMFDPDRGIKFFSYAVWWVRCYIMNFIAKSSKPQTGMIGHASGVVSLDTAMSDKSDNEECFVDHIPDEAPSQEDELVSRQSPILLFQILDSESCPLTGRERYILQRRYLDEPRPTLGQVAQSLNITKERVRQIENKSLEKMKHHIRENYSLEKDDFIVDYRSLPSGRGLPARMASAG
ncbi:MAG: sigma-70 family RNA polymerase sigma factor [Desulfomonilia bacterium]